MMLTALITAAVLKEMTVLTLGEPEGQCYGCIIESGYSLFGGPLFIPMKAAQWHMKQERLDFLGLKIPRSDALLPHH